MASTSLLETTGGYDCKFVEDPPDALKCLICLMVVRDPQQHGECGKLFCKSCITQHRRYKNDCPQCRQSLASSIFNDRKSAQDVKSLRVRCDNACPWIGELYNLDDHFTKCDNVIVQCSNKCQDGRVKLLRRNLRAHLTNKCPKRQYPCPHCMEKGEYQERTTTHITTCSKVKVRCPNAQCQVCIPRCEVNTHRSTCDYEAVSCTYAEVGCEERPLRIDLKKHEEDDQLHLRITTNTILQLKKVTASLQQEAADNQLQIQNTRDELLELKMKVAHLDKKHTQQAAVDNQLQIQNTRDELIELKEKTALLEKKPSHNSYTFKMTGYQKKKLTDEMFYSLPFNSHPNGYKMCIEVDANGDNNGKGTHVSVYAYVMKGDNDDSLTWPFTGSVTVELLNQLEDNNHREKKWSFPADDHTVSGRVRFGEKGRGYGHHSFIPHVSLAYDLLNNCQYLKEDSLVFRVSVDVPDHKPWLDCNI